MSQREEKQRSSFVFPAGTIRHAHIFSQDRSLALPVYHVQHGITPEPSFAAGDFSSMAFEEHIATMSARYDDLYGRPLPFNSLAITDEEAP